MYGYPQPPQYQTHQPAPQYGQPVPNGGTPYPTYQPRPMPQQAPQAPQGGGGAGVTTGAGGSSTMATVGTAAWIAAAVYAAVDGYGNYKKLKKEGKDPGEWTNEELDSVFHPDTYGLNKYVPEEQRDFSIVGKYGLGKFLTSSKNENQLRRDRVRDQLEETGFLSKNDQGSHQVQLADGSYYDVGRDGQTSFTGKDGKEVKHGYQSDWSNPLTGHAAGTMNPLKSMISAGAGGRDSGFSSQLVNASMFNADSDEGVRKNIRGFYDKMGIDRTTAIDTVNMLAEQGKLSEWEKLAQHNAVNEVFGDDGSGSYDYSKIGSGPSEEHQAAYDSFQNSEAGRQIEDLSQPVNPPAPVEQQPQESGMPPEIEEQIRMYQMQGM